MVTVAPGRTVAKAAPARSRRTRTAAMAARGTLRAAGRDRRLLDAPVDGWEDGVAGGAGRATGTAWVSSSREASGTAAAAAASATGGSGAAGSPAPRTTWIGA